MDYYITVIKKYAVFSGRAQRAEYWYFTLFNFIIVIVLAIVSTMIGDKFNILMLLYSIATLIPMIAVSVRRLHDTDHSGWWFLVSFIPLIGPIALIVFFMVRDSHPGQNQYGPNPKEVIAS